MQITKKVLSLLLACVLVLGLLPATALATEPECVYISASHDGQFINDQNGNMLAYAAVSMEDLESIDLNQYDLEDYAYDADGDGSYEITALHLYIYTHEVLCGGNWKTDVTVSGSPASIYFVGGLFGFEDENLRYNYNGAYPADENGWGFTADRIVLSAGDYFDVAHYSDWNFYADSAYGFHYFTDSNGSISHSFAAEAGEPVCANVILVGGGMGGGDTTTAEAGYTVYYGDSIGNAAGSVTTDDNGCAEFTFADAGTYYIWCDGGEGVDMAPGAIVSSPASAKVTVTAAAGGDSSSGNDQGSSSGEDYTTNLQVTADEGITLSATAEFCLECSCEVYSASDVTEIDETITWKCDTHGAECPDGEWYYITVNADSAEGYLLTGVTVNDEKVDIDTTDEILSTEYLNESEIEETADGVIIYITANAKAEDFQLHIYAEKENNGESGEGDGEGDGGESGGTTPETPRQPQSVSTVLNATMAKLANTVTAPTFGTDAGEWTVLSLARGGHYAKGSQYFTDYYNRIVETVNETAASVNMNGALNKNKSTDNSRLIVALSAIGKDATAVGNYNLVEPYSANGFEWINKQGINGTIWALIALDSNNYATTDTTIRQQCIDSILSMQHDDGGWSLMANTTYASDPDVTGMALTALYPYRDQPEVAAAAEEAFACLSAMQHDNGTFASGGSECAESCAWVIVSATTWGINPDTDSRFIKNGNSVVDALLTHYRADEAMFQHIVGAGSNAMATDQSCYALVAYNRYINNQSALFDYSDVTFDAAVPGTPTVVPDGTITATLTVPSELNNEKGTTFNATIQIDEWKNDAGYKLIDFEMSVPAGLKVTGVTAGSRLAGGTVNYNLAADGKLRCAYFDANENADLTVSGEDFPVEIFAIGFEIEEKIEAESLRLSITGMSVKLGSDSTDAGDIVVVDTVGKTEDGEGGEGGGDTGNTGTGTGNIGLVEGMSCSAVCLYTGAGVDLIPADKKAVAVSVTKIENGPRLTYNDGTNEVEFLYNAAISEKIGVCTYIALVDSSMEMTNFMNESYYTVGTETAGTLTFGDTNEDATVNAQDALAVVNAWLRKAEAPAGKQILAMNVNGDGNINTFDALGVVEAFVNIDNTYVIVTNAASAFSNVSAEASTETP